MDRAGARRTTDGRATRRLNLRRLGALLPVAGAFAAGSVVAWSWIARAPHRFAVDLAQPLVVVTAWGSYGGVAFAVLACTVLVAAAFAVAGARSLGAGAPEGDVTTVVLAAGFAIAAACTWPYVFSSDTYAYAAYGAMANAGLDPYLPLPASAQGAVYEAARWQWSGTYPVCVYGPAFVAVAAIIARATEAGGVAATLWALRLLAALAFLVSIPLLRVALGGLDARARWIALCAYGLNPVILWSVAEGHNDALLLLVVTAAGALARRRPGLGAFALGLSPLIKAPGAALALGAALDALFRALAGRWRTGAGVLAGLALAAAVSLPPLLPALSTAAAHGRYVPQVSVQGLIGLFPALGLALFAAVYGIVRLRARDRGGLAWLGIALLVALPNGYPWYALWLVPWCLGAGDTPASRALWAATISALARYLPDAWGTLGPETARLLSAAAALPLLLAVDDLRRTAIAHKKAVTAS